jgi:antitoxin PrlF
MSMAKLSSKSQIVLPAEIRRRLNIKPGDMLEVSQENDVITIRKAPISYVDELSRCASDLWQGYGNELARERREWDS